MSITDQQKDVEYKKRAITRDARVLVNVLLYWINRRAYRGTAKHKQVVLDTLMSILHFARKRHQVKILDMEEKDFEGHSEAKRRGGPKLRNEMEQFEIREERM